jgi:hypothetical protein
MIDTVKFLIPITNNDFLNQIKSKLIRTSRINQETNEIKFEYYTGEVEVGSYDRNVTLFLTDSTPIGLFVEFSLPKQYLNNNVEMINAYDIPFILKNFRNQLCEYLREPMPPLSEWIIYRLDVCYNWTFESEQRCQSLINLLQRIDYARKKKLIYDTSVTHLGSAYVVKFYLKGSEFLVHDFKKMIEVNEEKTHQLLDWAKKIVRFEVSFKKVYLKKLFKKDIVLISDISNNENIEKILQDYLSRVFKYINKENMKYEDVRQLINANFKPAKALRLYQFYKGYYFEKDEKYLIKKALNASTIWRYKTDLRNIGVSFEENLGDFKFVSVDELVIPSERGNFGLLDYKCNSDYI